MAHRDSFGCGAGTLLIRGFCVYFPICHGTFFPGCDEIKLRPFPAVIFLFSSPVLVKRERSLSLAKTFSRLLRQR